MQKSSSAHFESAHIEPNAKGTAFAGIRLPRVPNDEQDTVPVVDQSKDWQTLSFSPSPTSIRVDTPPKPASALPNIPLTEQALPLVGGKEIGLLFIQSRVGRGGKDINVFKFCTMDSSIKVPLATLQQGYRNGKFGKMDNDPRVTPVGKFLRSWGIDELPQIWNVLKGEMSLVGWRPLTRADLETFPKEFQEKYLQHKPAIVPAIYAFSPQGRAEVIACAMQYFKELEQRPFLTKCKYFFKALHGYFIEGKRGS